MSSNSDTDPTDSLTDEEIQKQLTDSRRDILTTLSAAEDQIANTSEIQHGSGVPRGSMDHFMRQFERWGLVERVDEEFVGQGGNATVWRLTERGDDFCKDRLHLTTESLVRPSDFDEMTDEVAALQQQVESIENELAGVKDLLLDLGEHTDLLSEEQAEEYREKLNDG